MEMGAGVRKVENESRGGKTIEMGAGIRKLEK